jgi:hypothetical protein
MQSISHEFTNNFCQLTSSPITFFVISFLIHVTVAVYNSESNDDLLEILFNPFSRKGFVLSWVAGFLIITVLSIISLISSLCK